MDRSQTSTSNRGSGVTRSKGTEIEWPEGDPATLPLPTAFDVVASSLGLQFVADKPSTLREMRRVLASGGNIAIATIRPTPPLFAVLENALERHVTPEARHLIKDGRMGYLRGITHRITP